MNEFVLGAAVAAAEQGWIPESLLRRGIRRFCAERLNEMSSLQSDCDPLETMVRELSQGPVAVNTAEANHQHYEVPTEVFLNTLGPRLKYSCGYWPDSVRSLAAAEEAALVETCRMAGLIDGMDVLELGCGWGSLALWMAEAYPLSRITAVSNSQTQKLFIEDRALRSGFANLRVITRDMNDFQPSGSFDRILSIEMFEHMSNYRELLRRISEWLRPSGRVFLHVFAHNQHTYKFESGGASNWMARNFFTGGVMPSRQLLTRFQEHLSVVDHQWWDGTHYQRTAEAWLENLSANRASLIDVFARSYGRSESGHWYRRWKMFYLACSELWGFRGGTEWGVGHYVFEAGAGQRRKSAAVNWDLAC